MDAADLVPREKISEWLTVAEKQRDQALALLRDLAKMKWWEESYNWEDGMPFYKCRYCDGHDAGREN